MLAIHNSFTGFTARWIDYCKVNSIPYKIVNCYKNDIISQLTDCSALLWQFYQGSYRDFIMARSVMNSVEHIGIKTFPDFNTAWHFDDKVAQKYLLEAIGAPFVPTWVFFDRDEAISWINTVSFPKVLKLRGGAGSQNVVLVETRQKAKKFIQKAFGKGFSSYDPARSFKERMRRYRLGKSDLRDLLEGLVRFFILPEYARVRGRERGYIYFQEYIAGNDSDIRVVVIDNKAFAIKRMVRKNDFRASGSGNILYDKSLINDEIIRLSFNLARKLRSQCVAFDYVNDDGRPMVVEISYGFSPEGYDRCPGYWDGQLIWHEGPFNPYGWIVESILANA